MAEQKEQEIKGWSDLPGDLLRRIAKKLNHIDDLRFHSVCKQWRLSMLCQRTPFVLLDPFVISPLPKSSLRFPLSLSFPMPPDPDINSELCGHFRLSESIIYLLQESPPSSSSCSWLLRVEECFDGRSWSPLIPLSHKLLSYSYPWFSGIRNADCFPKYINLVDYEISEIGRSGTVQFVDHSENSRQFTLPEMDSLHFRKVVVSPTPWPDEYGVMAITLGGKMAFCNLEVEAETWTPIQVDLVTREGGRFSDVVYHRNKFYALTDFGLLVMISQSMETEIIQPSPAIIGNIIDKLVEYGNDLYLIHDEYCNADGSKYLDNIFKLNEAGKTWEKVDASNIDDLVFFIGDDWSSAVSARNFAGLKPCYVYTSDELLTEGNTFEAAEGMNEVCGAIGVCNLTDDRVYQPLANLPDHWPIFWPPPAWLKPEADDIFGPHLSLPYESDILATMDDHGKKIEEIAQSQWRTEEIVGEISGVDKEEETGTSADDGKIEEKGAPVDEEE